MAGMKQELAQQIVETVKETCGYDINYITERGIVMASTDPTRIGTYHEVGHLAGQSGETIEVEKTGQYEGTQPGVNIPFYFHHVLVGIIGITGKPEEVRRYGQLAVRIMRLILKEKDLEQSLEVRRMQNTYILHQMMEGEAVNEKLLKEFLQVHQEFFLGQENLPIQKLKILFKILLFLQKILKKLALMVFNFMVPTVFLYLRFYHHL